MSDAQPPDPDWPVDVLRTDDSGELDLEQIEHNLSLTVEQRMEQYRQWMEFMQIAREAGRRHYGMELRPAQTPASEGQRG